MVRTVAEGLEAPWGMAFLPDGSALVSERDTTRVVAYPVRPGAPGRHRRRGAPQGEAGLLGLA